MKTFTMMEPEITTILISEANHIRTQPFSDKKAGLGVQQIVNAGLYNHVQSDQNTHICELLL